MADERAADLFAPRTGPVASLARRLRCTEGQVWSIALALLFAWVVSANGLPEVAWHRADAPAQQASMAAAPAAVTPPAGAHGSAGLLSVEPADVPPPPTGAPVGSDTFPGGPQGEFTPSPPEEAQHEVQDLHVASGGFASASAGSPLATVGVPDGSVAVARRAGRDQSITYLRLDGAGRSFTLEVDAGGANVLDALASIDVCRITDPDWQVGRGDTTLDDAPGIDCTHAVAGTRSPGGDRWTFDLGGLDHSGGIALVPTPDAAAPEFQVVFKIPGESEQP